MGVKALLLAVVVSCVPTGERAKPPVATPSVAGGRDSSVVASPTNASTAAAVNDTLVHPATILPAVSAACDSAAAIVRSAISLVADRRDGDYHDTQRGDARTGCRLSTQGSFKALPDRSSPVDILYHAFVSHHWRPDNRHSADGPDGSDVGMRQRENLCLVTGSWDGGDDSDTVPRAPTPEQDIYRIVVECARDAPPNSEADVPDSIWSIAARAGIDSAYAISLSMQSPPYIAGDFDGDHVQDAAVLVEQRATGKLGLVVVQRGTRRATVLAAGSGSAGPDDLDGLSEWDVFYKGSTPTLVSPPRPNTPLMGDALWVAREDSTSGFYIWNGTGFIYEPHRK